MPKAQVKYLSFPILPENQIIETFNSLQIETSNALKKPNSHNIREIYQQITIRLLDCSFEDIFGGKKFKKGTFTNPELHEQSIPYRSFSIIFPKILSFAGIEDFDEIIDIAKPNKKRVIIVLSGLLNLFKFSNALRDFSIDCETETANALKSLESTEKQLEALKKDKETISNKLKNDSGRCSEYTQSIEESEEQIKLLRTNVSKLEKSEAIARKHYKTSKDGLVKAKEALKEKTEKFTSLKEQIVSSPEKIKSMLSDLVQKISELKNKLEKREKRLKQCERYERITDKLLSKIESRVMDSAKIAEILKEIKVQKKNIKNLTLKIEEADQNIRCVKENKVALMGSLEIQKKRNEELQGEIKQQRKVLFSAWDNVQKSEQTAKKTRAKKDERAEDVRRKIGEIGKRLKRGNEREERLLAEANEEIKRFDEWWEDFDQRVDSVFGNFEARENRWASEIFEEEQLKAK